MSYNVFDCFEILVCYPNINKSGFEAFVSFRKTVDSDKFFHQIPLNILLKTLHCMIIRDFGKQFEVVEFYDEVPNIFIAVL